MFRESFALILPPNWETLSPITQALHPQIGDQNAFLEDVSTHRRVGLSV